MPRPVSGSAGGPRGLSEVAQLASLLTGARTSGGLIGSGYRAAMATPVHFAASDSNCADCHLATPPQPPPPVSLPNFDIVPERWKVLPPLLGAGRWMGGLPPPLGSLVAAGRIAGALAGPQVSALTPPRDPPKMPPDGDPYKWSSRPECTMQHERDIDICNRLKPPNCWSQAAVRLGNCNKGRLDFPPLLGW